MDKSEQVWLELTFDRDIDPHHDSHDDGAAKHQEPFRQTVAQWPRMEAVALVKALSEGKRLTIKCDFGVFLAFITHARIVEPRNLEGSIEAGGRG